ncbi:hypothetical protein PAXINDRAFT_159015 [Paxillus involutus ATCC 200175]|uniref:Uncharacterized protein n=1 Tax=Paxillus involutus ATCC 200175 TaxID=664439 RepID=A0A0C9TBE1_PAXIN|nr:hypothetical protein PAXINDRAFT_159015 [Paxillus involutus ATCC 200175]
MILGPFEVLDVFGRTSRSLGECGSLLQKGLFPANGILEPTIALGEISSPLLAPLRAGYYVSRRWGGVTGMFSTSRSLRGVERSTLHVCDVPKPVGDKIVLAKGDNTVHHFSTSVLCRLVSTGCEYPLQGVVKGATDYLNSAVNGYTFVEDMYITQPVHTSLDSTRRRRSPQRKLIPGRSRCKISTGLAWTLLESSRVTRYLGRTSPPCTPHVCVWQTVQPDEIPLSLRQPDSQMSQST